MAIYNPWATIYAARDKQPQSIAPTSSTGYKIGGGSSSPSQPVFTPESIAPQSIAPPVTQPTSITIENKPATSSQAYYNGSNQSVNVGSPTVQQPKYGVGGTFQQPFFSVAGQKERISNVGNVLAISTGIRKGNIRANVGGTTSRRVLETVAEHPFLSAGVVAGAFGAGTNVVGVTGRTILMGGAGFAGFAAGREQGLTSKDIELIGKPGYREALSAGFTQEKQALSGSSWITKIAYEIPSVPLLIGDKKQFTLGVTKELERQGVTPSQIQRMTTTAMKERTTGFGAEGVGLLTGGVGSELGGQALVAKEFGKTGIVKASSAGKKAFVKGFVAISKAGIGEGIIGEATQEIGRGETLKGGKIAAVGSLGAFSAGTIGGGIVGLTVGKKTLSAKTLNLIAYGTDPFEYPSDILAGGVEKIGIVRVPTPTLVFEQERSVTFGSTSIPDVTGSYKKSVGGTPVHPPKPLMVTSPTKVSNVRFDTYPNIITGTPTRTKTPSDIFVPPNVKTPTDIIVPNPSNVPTNIGVKTNTKTPTKTNVLTNTNIPTNINVNVVVPMARFPFFIPGGGGSGRGFNRNFFGGRVKGSYTPSLVATAFNIRGKQTTGMSGFEIRKIVGTPTKKKKGYAGGA